MSKEFPSWKIEETPFPLPDVQDYAPTGHLSRPVVVLVREELLGNNTPLIASINCCNALYVFDDQNPRFTHPHSPEYAVSLLPCYVPNGKRPSSLKKTNRTHSPSTVQNGI